MLSLQQFVDVFNLDIGIDLGTANTLVYVKGEGIVLREPSVVAVDSATNRVLAVGIEAKRMLGRTPGNITAVRPMKDGVIADFDITQEMLNYFIRRVVNGRGYRYLTRPRVVISVPTGITEVERRAVRESAVLAGARAVTLIEEPMAAAIGARLPVNEPIGSMVIDIGGGTTEVAVISLGGIVTAKSVRVAGDAMDDAIVQHVKRKYNLMIGPRTAEDIKILIGSADALEDELIMRIKGRDLMGGLPRTIEVHSEEVREALWEPVSQIVNAVRVTLERTPPELAGDIVERGICMAGGSSQLRNLPRLISQETGVPVYLAKNPETAIVEGAGRVLESLDTMQKLEVGLKG
ncbi:MAG: rod shape-determining protein [Candidatus Sumerlaeia bacterium]|jgi:rod shape-determining protein MreB|nr:rod shape-determining protein [Candidatus Sumerlaeia bacterium]